MTVATSAAAAERRIVTEFPDVPGMYGSRRANELWYQFDEVTMYKSDRELTDAYIALGELFGGDLERRALVTWQELSAAPEYPHNYAEFVAPAREAFAVLSRAQLGVFDTYYRKWGPGLASAFVDFGQGVLFDPRRADVRSEVHSMNGNPPRGYHVWHAYMRAMMLLDVDARRWRSIARYNALAWAVQTVAKPNLRTVNPELPKATVAGLAATWLPRGPSQLDAEFQSFPYPR
ncbi:hypothetical protein MUK60_37435 [Streptomyces sp. LRE541]|uniref:hypothetical protein n=2 Tax=Streptomyces TaxID=1883 RepID=UPI00200E25D9|nr:hypothetical protein [Streptomyces sp. LRE541]UPZ32979.1 hypothetical protein MUK60_37435 [Streptomyces sp. LRE541]